MTAARCSLLLLLAGCASPTEAAKVDDVKAGKIAEVSLDEGPSADMQKPIEFGDDRRAATLSFPVFPAGEVRFYDDLDEGRIRSSGAPPRKVEPQLCEIDRDCRSPDRCLHPAGSPGVRGVCGRTTTRPGQPESESRYVQACKQQWECPDAFDCVLVNGPFGVCVRLTER